MVVLGVAACAAVIGVLIVLTTANNVTVIRLERNMEMSQSGMDNKDCHITGFTPEHNLVSGYGPSSYCTSVKVGDTVTIRDGVVTK